MLDQGGGAMQMQSAFAALCDRGILQDLGLKRRAKSFGLADSSSLAAASSSASEAIPRSL